MSATEFTNPEAQQSGTGRPSASTIPAQDPGVRIGRGSQHWLGSRRRPARGGQTGGWTAGRAGAGERGSSVVEFVVVAPALMLMVALIVAGGRLALAQHAVESSAAQAARTASIARVQADADATAHAAAQASLHAQGTRCSSVRVILDTTGFATPVGAPASVEASVTCRLDLAGLLPQLPGAVDVTATADSPLDTYRER